jgi:hypothetical protein
MGPCSLAFRLAREVNARGGGEVWARSLLLINYPRWRRIQLPLIGLVVFPRGD